MGAPSIALTSLKIRDFRGINSLDLDLKGPDGLPNRLVVLGGANGGGKTTVLEAAFLVLGGRGDLVTGAVGQDAVRRGAEDFLIEAEAKIAEGSGLLPFDHPLAMNSSSGSRSPLHPDLFEYFTSWRAPSLVGSVDPTVGKRGRKPAETDHNRLLNVKQRLVNAAAIERFEAQPASPSYTEIKSAIDQAWRTFHPGQGQSFDVEIARGSEEDGGSFDVFLKSPGEPSPLSVDLLSSGQLELFLFLGSLALAGNRPGVIFIDEPELHLDPQWHRALVRTLLFLRPTAQFMLATHSPEVFAEAKSYERHFLVPADDPRATAWANAVPARNGA
ncbi:AAA family ATPase [Paludisphaera sp.]|uniref:AAA family ATPase n=1 Tax=Paludisphaera sp. TaxID=2017432 RepID=UPI00301D4449